MPQPTAPYRRLLILACSATKRGRPIRIPARDRYDGPLWRTLRAADPDGCKAKVAFLCHETIYRYAYSSDGQELKLWRYFPESRARCRPRHARRRHGRRFSPELSILHRPDIVRDRKQLGHWECDLIQFRKKFGKANVTSLVERVSRFTVLLRNNDRQSRSIMDGLINALGPLPHSARGSITFDRGTEFKDWSYLQAGWASLDFRIKV